MAGAAVLMGVWPFGGWPRGDGSADHTVEWPAGGSQRGKPLAATPVDFTQPSNWRQRHYIGLLSLLFGTGRAREQPTAMLRPLTLGLWFWVATALWVGPQALARCGAAIASSRRFAAVIVFSTAVAPGTGHVDAKASSGVAQADGYHCCHGRRGRLPLTAG